MQKKIAHTELAGVVVAAAEAVPNQDAKVHWLESWQFTYICVFRRSNFYE